MIIFLTIVAIISIIAIGSSLSTPIQPTEDYRTKPDIWYKPLTAVEKLEEAIKCFVEGTIDPQRANITFTVGFLPADFADLKFTVIDFETANKDRCSAIVMGIAHFHGNRLVDAKEYRFKNVDGADFEFTHIHGLTADDVLNEPYFDTHWTEIEKELEGKLIVAHNADFDYSVLKSLLEHFKLALPDCQISCTYKLAKQVLKREDSYALKNLCESYEIPYWKHQAVYDAISAGILFMVIISKSSGLLNIEPMLKGISSKKSENSKASKSKKTATKIQANSTSAEGLNYSDLSQYITPTMFEGKNIVVTGKYYILDRQEVEEYVLKMGAKLMTHVNGRTALVIIGDEPGPAKVQQIIALQEVKILPVIDETEFLKVIEVLDL